MPGPTLATLATLTPLTPLAALAALTTLATLTKSKRRLHVVRLVLEVEVELVSGLVAVPRVPMLDWSPVRRHLVFRLYSYESAFLAWCAEPGAAPTTTSVSLVKSKCSHGEQSVSGAPYWWSGPHSLHLRCPIGGLVLTYLRQRLLRSVYLVTLYLVTLY